MVLEQMEVPVQPFLFLQMEADVVEVILREMQHLVVLEVVEPVICIMDMPIHRRVVLQLKLEGGWVMQEEPHQEVHKVVEAVEVLEV